MLLPALVRHAGASRQLMAMPSWRSLVAAFASRQALLTSGLGLKLQRALAQVCVRVCVRAPECVRGRMCVCASRFHSS